MSDTKHIRKCLCACAYTCITISVCVSEHLIAYKVSIVLKLSMQMLTAGFQITPAQLVLFLSASEEIDSVHVTYFYVLGAYSLTMTRNSLTKLEITKSHRPLLIFHSFSLPCWIDVLWVKRKNCFLGYTDCL